MKAPILLVDNCRENLENLQEFLELEGFSVIGTVDPKEALQKAQKCLPSLLITDIQMRTMTGFELVKSLRRYEETCQIPFIFHSTLSEPYLITKGLNLGALAYIVKPHCLDQLVVLLSKRIDLT